MTARNIVYVMNKRVNVPFIALISLFDRTQGCVCDEKAGRLT